MLKANAPNRLLLTITVLFALLIGFNYHLSRQLAIGSAILDADGRLVDNLRDAIRAAKAFGDLKYWLLELAVGTNDEARRQAQASSAELDWRFDRLERLEGETVAVLRLETGALMDSTMIAIEAYEEGDREQGARFLEQGLEHVRVVDRRLEGLVRLLEADLSRRRDDAVENAGRAESLSMALMAMGAVVGLMLLFSVLRSVRPLSRMIGAVSAMTRGDLDAEIPQGDGVEAGDVARELSVLRESLRDRARLAVEQRSAEERVRQVEAQLVDAIESLPVGFALYDADDRLVLTNGRYHELVSPSPAHRAKPGAAFSDMARAAAEQGFVRNAEGRLEEWLAERNALHRDPGEPHVQERSNGKWVQVTERRTHDGGTVAVYEDITELKRREVDLAAANRDKDDVLRERNAVLDAIDYGVLFMDENLDVRLVNRAYKRIWQYPPDFDPDAHRTNLRDLYGYTRRLYEVEDEDWEEFVEERMVAVREGRPRHSESVLATGEVLERQCVSLPDGGRMITYFDITERKRTEVALRRIEERYALAVAGSNDGLWDWDEDSGELYVSPRARAIAGIPEGTDASDVGYLLSIVHPEDLPGYREVLRGHLRGESEYFSYEGRVRATDGRYRWVRIRGLGLRRDDGHVYRMSGSLSDIDARKETELALVAAKEQAESATRTKSRFLANMSHELRTPLNAVIGISEMLREEAVEEGRRDAVEPLDRIVGAGRHLLRLINDILDLTRIEAGRMEVRAEPFDVAGVVEDAVATVRPLAGKQHTAIEVRVGDGVGQMRSDVTRVRQILLNLLSNACKFTQDGQVTVGVEQTRDGDGEWIEWRIADTGIGMDPGQLEHLFEEFVQGDSTVNERYGGTGLGLTISQRLCEILGGSIGVASTPGVGTTFTVRLPRAPR